MTTSLKHDLSVLTTLDESYVGKLLDKARLVIADSLHDAREAHDDTLEVDLTFGTLVIKIYDDCIKYKFVPSKTLERSLSVEPSTLNRAIEASLVAKLTNIYKNLL